MNYQSYKGRSIDFSKPVKVYKNLHNGLFSVMQDNLVVAHVESFTMRNVVFKVNQAGREKVIKEGKKNVHAFVTGMLISVNSEPLFGVDQRITYNPYKQGYFYYSEYEDEMVQLDEMDCVHGDSKQGLFLTAS